MEKVKELIRSLYESLKNTDKERSMHLIKELKAEGDRLTMEQKRVVDMIKDDLEKNDFNTALEDFCNHLQ